MQIIDTDYSLLIHILQFKIYKNQYCFAFKFYTVLHMSGKKDGKLDKSIQQQPVIAECICPPMTHYKVLTMDDMQLPYGNWKKQHEKRNKSYNIVLLFGLASLIGSIKVVSETKIFFF